MSECAMCDLFCILEEILFVCFLLSSRETDLVNVKTDVNFCRAREILARSFLQLEY